MGLRAGEAFPGNPLLGAGPEKAIRSQAGSMMKANPLVEPDYAPKVPAVTVGQNCQHVLYERFHPLAVLLWLGGPTKTQWYTLLNTLG